MNPRVITDSVNGTKKIDESRTRFAGIDLLRACGRVADNTREDAFYRSFGAHGGFESFSAPECLSMLTACIESEWSITPCQLTTQERRYAARYCRLSPKCIARLRAELGGA